MRLRNIGRGVAVGVALAWGQAPALAQLPLTPPPPVTIWSFLGIPQGVRNFQDNNLNRFGNRPGMERKPPLKAIADPRNLESPDPAIKKAAEVKAAEDLAPQKIKAIKYLAKIGCGCYNRDGSITDALIKAMDDCTEAVRYTAVTAISEAAAGEYCANCKEKSCCSEEISKKLYELAYERDETGCPLEPSERVRLAAAEALRTCCASNGTSEEMYFEVGPRTTTEGGTVPETPSVVPPTTPEQPTPGLPPAPQPGSVIPLQNTPPAAFPPATSVPYVPAPTATRPIPAQPATTEAPASAPPQRSSRRTAMLLQHQETEPAAVESASSPAAESAAATHEFTPAATAAAIHILAPASQPIPLTASGVNASVSTETEAQVEAVTPPAPAYVATPLTQSAPLPPVVNPASLRRLPAVAGLPADQQPAVPTVADRVPAPPLPPAGKPAIPVSAAKSRLDFLKKSTTPSTRPAQPAGRPATSGLQRGLPGTQYGTGMVSAVHLKDSVALVEFSSDRAIPAGSIVRAYHEYAFVGKKPVCDLEIIRGENGMAAAIARPGSDLATLTIGDQALVLE